MNKLLVNTPRGAQEIVEVDEGGGYFDATRVLWDERTDGPLPVITIGGMKRAGNGLVMDAELLAASNTAKLNAEKVSVRNQRNSLIAATDWTQLPDVPQSIKFQWAPYRQALRDVPQQAGFPFNVVWPT